MGRDSLSLLAAPPTAAGSSSTAAGSSSTALAPGFRFHPTDEELVSYYLKRKVLSKPVRFDAIGEVDIYKHEPWDLAVYSRFKTRDQEWYFFSALDKKYGNGARMNRATNKGYWKATGKDREIRRDSQLIGMKKTLVFHSGRAPDGLRTNWVMHEYRFADYELEKSGGIQDAYVLCRVFHKNNIGPPSGNRYAPFVEEEWDDGKMALIPGEPVREPVVGADDTKGSNDSGQEIQSINKGLININELPKDSHTDHENANHRVKCSPDCPPLCILNGEAPSPILRYKRRRQNDCGTSNNSSRTTPDHCSSSTTTTADTMLTSSAATTTAISALLEFSLVKQPVVSEAPPPPPPPAAPSAPQVDNNNNIQEVSLPVECGKIISELEMEIRKMSVERETSKLEMMSAEAMISILQSRIDALRQENEELRIGIKGA